MANINPVDVSYFDSFADEIMGKFNRLGHLVSHSGSTGNYHEEVLRTVLRNFLTKRYSVKTGFIYADKDNVSNQIDILVVDESAPAAYIFQEGDFAVVIPEAVAAFIEVKTTLSAKEFDLGVKNIASAKRLMEFPVNHCGILFGYQGRSKPKDTTIDSWFKRESTQDMYSGGKFFGPDMVIFLKDNFSMLKYDMNTKTIANSEFYHSFVNPAEGHIGWQLSVMLAMVVAACEHGEFRRTRTFGKNQANRLIGMNEMEVSDLKFKLGEGKVQE